MEKKKTHRKCPHCGGKTGFEVTVSLGGTEIKKVKFSGKVFEDERDGTDDIEKHGICLDCKKLIPIEKLDTRNV